MNPSMTGAKCTCSYFFNGDIIYRTKSLQSQGHKLWLTLSENLKPDWKSYDARICLYLVDDNTQFQLLGDIGYFGQEKRFSLQHNHGIQQAIADFNELTIDIRCKTNKGREPELWYWKNGERKTFQWHANPSFLFKIELLRNGQYEGSCCFTNPFLTACRSSSVNKDQVSQLKVVELKDQLSSFTRHSPPANNITNSSNLEGHDAIDLAADLNLINPWQNDPQAIGLGSEDHYVLEQDGLGSEDEQLDAPRVSNLSFERITQLLNDDHFPPKRQKYL